MSVVHHELGLQIDLQLSRPLSMASKGSSVDILEYLDGRGGQESLPQFLSKNSRKARSFAELRGFRTIRSISPKPRWQCLVAVVFGSRGAPVS